MIPVRSFKRSTPLARRDFLRVVPAGITAGILTSAQVSGQSDRDTSTDALIGTTRMLGLDFTGDEHELMRASVARNNQRYFQLRNTDLPADIEPAFFFRPYLSGDVPAGNATPNMNMTVASSEHVERPADLNQLAFWSISDLAQLIERRLLTSTELTRIYLNRLKRYGERLRCVVTLTDDLALAEAAQADQEIRNGRYRGLLHGIPWGIKDLFSTRGVRTTWGARPYQDQIIDMDATVVSRLRKAGAVLVAKLSMGALARGDRWFRGLTRNPWDVSRGSSGSSAGPASATAAGLVAFSIGTETLGSIISPSATCGVTGLRPSFGRVSRHGAMTLSWTMDKVGPICRTVDDCAVVFNAIYGPDDKDSSVINVPFTWQAPLDMSNVRIGYVAQEFDRSWFDQFSRRPDQSRKEWAALNAVLTDFRNGGVTIQPIELPRMRADILRLILDVEAASAFDDLTRNRGIDLLTDQRREAWPTQFRAARLIPAVEYVRAQRVRVLLGKEMDRIMNDVDIVLSPTRSLSLTMTNLTGHPALAMKAGFVDGLPVSIMLTGRLYEEASLLKVARFYERLTKWHTMHPDVE